MKMLSSLVVFFCASLVFANPSAGGEDKSMPGSKGKITPNSSCEELPMSQRDLADYPKDGDYYYTQRVGKKWTVTCYFEQDSKEFVEKVVTRTPKNKGYKDIDWSDK